MTATQTRPGLDEFGLTARALYEREVVPRLWPEDHGKFVAVDVETGDFEVHEDDYQATMCVRTRHPGGLVWLERAGYPTTYVFRSRVSSAPIASP